MIPEHVWEREPQDVEEEQEPYHAKQDLLYDAIAEEETPMIKIKQPTSLFLTGRIKMQTGICLRRKAQMKISMAMKLLP